MKRLVLFDIDGTLLWGGPLWKECFLKAFARFFPEWTFPLVPFGGKTDVQICREMMAAAGFDEAATTEHMHRIVDLYVELATQALRSRASEVTVLPGVKDLLEKLSAHPDVLLGLLTGNVRKGAAMKLGCAGLQKHFRFGVYGDDNWNRYKLPELAISRARELFGVEFAGKQIVIIGDTVHDVRCGKEVGARSIAVGTGKGPAMEELLAHEPDYYFHDLSDTATIIGAILEEL